MCQISHRLGLLPVVVTCKNLPVLSCYLRKTAGLMLAITGLLAFCVFHQKILSKKLFLPKLMHIYVKTTFFMTTNLVSRTPFPLTHV